VQVVCARPVADVPAEFMLAWQMCRNMYPLPGPGTPEWNLYGMPHALATVLTLTCLEDVVPLLPPLVRENGGTQIINFITSALAMHPSGAVALRAIAVGVVPDILALDSIVRCIMPMELAVHLPVYRLPRADALLGRLLQVSKFITIHTGHGRLCTCIFAPARMAVRPICRGSRATSGTSFSWSARGARFSGIYSD
jgi:hypothetical protein